MNNQNFGEFLQTKREQQKITLRQLAEKLGVSAPFLSDVEKGRRNSLDMDKLVMLKRILALSEDEYERAARKNALIRRLPRESSARLQ